MTYSKTFLGIVIVALGEMLKSLGINIGSEDLSITVFTLLQVGGGLLVIVERFKKGGVNWFGFKD